MMKSATPCHLMSEKNAGFYLRSEIVISDAMGQSVVFGHNARETERRFFFQCPLIPRYKVFHVMGNSAKEALICLKALVGICKFKTIYDDFK